MRMKVFNATAEVLLYGSPIGNLSIKGDFSRFWFCDEYIEDADRAVLGLQFEEDLRQTWRASQRVPPWFSNLLPEGELRNLVARDQGVSARREAQLLLRLGRDLPGAVEVRIKQAEAHASANAREGQIFKPRLKPPSPWRFSLAGVALKFSGVRESERFTLLANDDEDSDWIVKLPDHKFSAVPENEFCVMSLAGEAGIDVPEIELVHRDRLPHLPCNVWPENAEFAFAIRRFDRGPNRQRVHIEDFAQVRNFYPEDRYLGTFESVASICYRRHDIRALSEFVKRFVFNSMIGNGDAHLKNWSLIYADRRIPTLSPAYDLVATQPYIASGQLGLKFDGSSDFSRLRIASFGKLQRRLGAKGLDLCEIASDMVDKVLRLWCDRGADLLADQALFRSIDGWVREQAQRMRRGIKD